VSPDPTAPTLTVVPLTHDDWPGLAALFSEGGDPRWCWCMYWRDRSTVSATKSTAVRRSELEALAAGLPVVGPDRGGPPTFVEDGTTGFLVDTTDLASLRTGLRRAASVRLDPARAARARSLVEERFTIDAMAGRLVELYERVTRRPALRAA